MVFSNKYLRQFWKVEDATKQSYIYSEFSLLLFFKTVISISFFITNVFFFAFDREK